jgi:hypothetical protein
MLGQSCRQSQQLMQLDWIISELVETGASRKVKLTVLLSPLKVSIAKVADVGRFPMKANLFSSYVFYLYGHGWPILSTDHSN